MTDRLTLLEAPDHDGVIVEGSPWGVWMAVDDARRSGLESVALFRGKDRFDVRTDVAWRIKEWEGGR